VLLFCLSYCVAEFVNQGWQYDSRYPWDYRSIPGHTAADNNSLDVFSVEMFLEIETTFLLLRGYYEARG